jgi:glutamate-1-semialdehyde 2,1-aminomutase
VALDAVARTAGMHVSGRGSLMTIHAGGPPFTPAVPLSREHALAKELVFFALLERGYWLARRGMLTVSIPVTDAMCDDLVAAFDDVVRTHRDHLAAVSPVG